MRVGSPCHFTRPAPSLLCCLVLIAFKRVDAQGLFNLASLTCSQAGQDRCAETNEACGVLAEPQDNTNEICFACQVGYVRLREEGGGPCLDIDNLTMQDYLDAFPEAIFVNREVPLAERLERLRRAAQAVSQVRRTTGTGDEIVPAGARA